MELGDRSYPIYIQSGLLGQDIITKYISGRQVCVVTNETIAPLYLEPLLASLANYKVASVVLPDGEKYKNLEVLNHIFNGLLKARHNRSTTLIALGGGVVGDMTGFAAACYQRGVKFIQIPTTLLSMVDSSVGGKTGVNHAMGKNMIGAFHQPEAVLADISVLQTLSPRELSSGLAEVIKYGLICDPVFFDWLEEHMDALLVMEHDALAYAIRRSCENKAKIVAEDERESGVRAILNLGHTFGHAIETALGYGEWLHGEAVAAGMVMALDLSMRMGAINNDDCARAVQLLQRANLPVKAPASMSNERFIELMEIDKKVQDGRLRLVLLHALGQAYVADNIDSSLLHETLAACRAD